MGFPEELHRLRHERGLSQSELASALGVSQASIGYWEKGQRTPSIDAVRKVCSYFGVTLEDMVSHPTETIDLFAGLEPLNQGFKKAQKEYYQNKETAEMAQKIFENKELRLLFDAAQDADPEDLQMVHTMLLALKRKERVQQDEGC